MLVTRTLYAVAASVSAFLIANGAFAQTAAAPPPFPLEMFKALQAMPGSAPAPQDEDSCKASAVASWRPDSQPAVDWSKPAVQLAADLIHPVTADEAAASAKLAAVTAAPVSLAEAARFTGVSQARLQAAKPNAKPYLVRSVYPVPKPTLGVTWYGDMLEVAAEGEGCAPFRNTPLLVLLDRPPAGVFVGVSAGH
ncbi:MAG: hypothetical protein BGN86_10640 [Caulobacterales bacterium 68-7]|nr:hypothetical protein [Caulobacterales bacterium]OJU07458.1 MAG: hypothetical protein BGN86_10640 [Caulobacterales bacterium 68-7]